MISLIRTATFFTAAGVLILAIALSPTATERLASYFFESTPPTKWYSRLATSTTRKFSLYTSKMSTPKSDRTPIYFLGHGGPNIIYDTKHPVFPKLQSIGREITQKVKPKAVVVISAHWESSTPGVVEVNVGEKTALIYDFYGFPAHYYTATYPHIGSPSLAQTVIASLAASGIPAKPVTRGLDHGVWASFSIAFPPDTNSLFPNIPLVQVSLPFASSNPEPYFALGKALAPLREEGVAIITSGMAVHNLRDIRYGFSTPQPYAVSFDKGLKEAVETEPEQRQNAMKGLLKRADLKSAHPSLEHLWPVYVAAGAAGEEEKAVQIWTKTEGPMSWAMFRFGEV